MSRFIIQGGKCLSGRHVVSGNKNAALPMLAASLLTDKPVTLHNVPLIEDVNTMLALLSDIGVSVSIKNHTVKLSSASLKKLSLDPDLCKRVRSSILFAGPLTAKYGRATIFSPGGDVIGRRRIDTHLSALMQLGASVSCSHSSFTFRAKRLKGTNIILDEASVTATENAIMAAVMADGCTTIFNAACEPHVQDLCHMLNKMGARIKGIGTNFLVIHGVKSLHGVSHEISPDYIDAISYAAAAVVTKGNIILENMPYSITSIIEKPLFKTGIKWKASKNNLMVNGRQLLTVKNDIGHAIPKIEDGPWPAFPSDLMSIAIVIATQSSGTLLFFEKMFESRLYFVDRLIDMGARIVQCDPHRVIVTGPTRLHGTHLSSPDIRAGMALLIAALCAKGRSIIDNAQIIDRGYENADLELQKLGADISRVD